MNPKPILPTTDQEKIVPTIDFVKMTRELSKSVDTFKKETKQWNRFFDEIGKKNRSMDQQLDIFYISIKRKFKHINVDYSNIVDLSDPYSIRMANDKIMQIERTFLVDMPEDWPDKEANRLIKRK